MPIWKLTPDEKKLTEPNWEASTRKSEITIEAANEDEARKKAKMLYGRAAKRAPDKFYPIVFWESSSLLVWCGRLWL